MIGAHAYGIMHDYKTVGKTMANCLVCREYSPCKIIRYKKYTHIFFIPIKVHDEQYYFDWKSCKHRAILYDPEHVARYREEQVKTRMLGMPSFHHMRLQFTETPKNVPLIQIILVLAVSLVLAAGIIYIKEKLGIPFLP